jgi:G3E family GTPase
MNEFGKEPLDQELMERRDIPLALLSGGCVCCTVRGALAPMLKNLYMSRSAGTAHFDGVVMETSGVADPGPVLDTLLKDRWLATRYRLLAIMATVDAQHGLESIESFPEAARQVALADRLLITKTDLVAPEAAERLRLRLKALNPAAETVFAARGEWEVGGLSASAAFHQEGWARRLASPLVDGTAFESAALVFNKPLRGDVPGVLNRLLGAVGHSLLRIKGVLELEGEPSPIAVHAVAGHLYPCVRLAGWPEGGRRSRLVAISLASDREVMQRFFSEFERAVV